MPLQRRVGEQVAEARKNTEEARPESGCEIEIHRAGKRKNDAEAQCFCWCEHACGQWTRSSAAHVAVGFPLDVMVQRGGSGGDHHRGNDDVEHVQPPDGTARAHVVARAGGHQHQERNIGLGERDVGADLARLCEGGGADFTHQAGTSSLVVAKTTSLFRGTRR